MRFLISLCFFLSLASSPAFSSKNQCVICHATLGDKHQKIVKNFESDVHRRSGLFCNSCHGGNPNTDDIAEAKSSEAGFIGVPTPTEIPGFCGRCHSKPNFMRKYNPSLPVDQEEKYFTSIHGLRLKAGDTKVATCASCHRPHSILPAKEPASSVYAKNIHETCGQCHADPKHMAPYKIPTDQVAQYTKSVHGKALLELGDMAVPTCNDCHGNHGAIPPGVENIALVCGLCHTNNMELFKESPMAGAWSKKNFHGCAVCHSNHDIEHPATDMLGGETSVCKKCHLPSHKGYKVGLEMKELLDKMETTFNGALGEIKAAEEKGMDVSDAQDTVQEARQSFLQAKTTVHTFRLERVKEVVDKGLGLALHAQDLAQKAVKEFRRRRIGLGISTIFITLLIIAIYLWVKELERKK